MNRQTILLREQLANYAHEAWSKWMRYLGKKSILNMDGSITIPRELVNRWHRQIDTPYQHLSETEKDSDRKEADMMLAILGDFQRLQTNTMRIIYDEVEYAQNLWEPRKDRPLNDASKPVEFWVMHIIRYAGVAMRGCYGTDKSEALEAIRKIAALCVRCIDNNDTPERKV